MSMSRLHRVSLICYQRRVKEVIADIDRSIALYGDLTGLCADLGALRTYLIAGVDMVNDSLARDRPVAHVAERYLGPDKDRAQDTGYVFHDQHDPGDVTDAA